MTRYLTVLLLCLSLLSCAEGGEHFLGKDDAIVYEDLQKKMADLPYGNLFSILQSDTLDTYEREALSFLYAYSPESDIVDRDGNYFLENVRLTRKALGQMPWGARVSAEKDLVQSFVLPIRVNNEPLDDSRKMFFESLRDRVGHMTMEEAVLEINHWCHERVTYRPADARTSSPLQTLRTAYGRCGEESTFLVAALRSVGIPARQVYTPRWAHTDDNHAWVEAWVDGKWRFLGACEPEPVLDMGWFNVPSTRTMLIHTKVFGHTWKRDDILQQRQNFTEINVIGTYADTSRVRVRVVDNSGTPVKDACVEFKLYNYAEFYTLASQQTDTDGFASFLTGKGSLLVWARKDGKYGYQLIDVSMSDSVTVELEKDCGSEIDETFDLHAPVGEYRFPEVTRVMRAENDRRFSLEDSIRQAYESTMMDRASAEEWVGRNGIDKSAVSLMVDSRGNHASISEYLLKAENKDMAVRMLKSLSEKDLRDAPASVLLSQLEMASSIETAKEMESVVYDSFVLCPRIALEPLTTYRSFFQNNLPSSLRDSFRENIQNLISWVRDNISVNDEINMLSVPVSPEGVYRARVADSVSRDIFFVAVCRTLGIAARINEVTSDVEYYHSGKWDRVDFSSSQGTVSKGVLHSAYTPAHGLDNPDYYTHFTISRLDEECGMNLLSYDEGSADMGGGADYRNLLSKGLELEEGSYIMVTGTRSYDGSVLATMKSFHIESDRRTDSDLVLRGKEISIEEIGRLDVANVQLLPVDRKGDVFRILEPAVTLPEISIGGDYIVALIGVGQEPTNHFLRDISDISGQLERWHNPVILVFQSMEAMRSFRIDEFRSLPKTVSFAVDIEGKLASCLQRGCHLASESSLPMVCLASGITSSVYLASQGYATNFGQQILQVINAK